MPGTGGGPRGTPRTRPRTTPSVNVEVCSLLEQYMGILAFKLPFLHVNRKHGSIIPIL